MENEAPTLNPALRDFWKKPARNRVLYGGRASSKSWDAAGFAIYLAANYRVKFLCARKFQNRIADSVYTLLKIQIDRFGLSDQFKVLENSIAHLETGSEFLFYGLARNINEIKSTEGVDVCWIEEAHGLTEEEWKVLEPTLRGDGSQFWIIFNPQFVADFVYQRFIVNTPADTVIRKINYEENPFLSKTMLKVIENAREEDEEAFRHVYLGEPMENEEGSVIRRTWIRTAIDAHKKLGFEPSGKKTIGFDVADDGADKCATASSHGSVLLSVKEWSAGEDEILKSCTIAWSQALEYDADDIVYDCIGVGASAGAKFNELNDARKKKVRHKGFNAGAGVFEPNREYVLGKTNQDHFSNIKAQAWWGLADRFKNTYNAITHGHSFPVDKMISISSDCQHLEKLITELSTPKRDFDANGRVKVESKKDLAKRDVKSPNLADSIVMCYAPVSSPMRISGAALEKALGR